MSSSSAELNGKNPVDRDQAVIRPFRPSDRKAVRDLACATALMGDPCSNFFDGDEIFADALTAYHTDFEPESCYVAEQGGRVIGYLIGAKNTAVMDTIIKEKIAWPLLSKALTGGVFLRPKNIRFLGRLVLSAVRGEFRDPDFTKNYPATLHINIAYDHRGGGIGARLIGTYLRDLRAANVPGVRLATFSDRACQFFAQQGFKVLYQTRRSYFRPILKRDINLYILGRVLAG